MGNELPEISGTTADVPTAVGSRSVVKVECGASQGTATCVHSSGTSGLLFVTCAHVVDHKLQSVVLWHDGRAISGRTVYAARRGVPYDVAVIFCEQNADVEPCPMLDGVPTAAQKVITMGYGLTERFISTVCGRVIRVTDGQMMTTCRVRQGFSGGPAFTTRMQLLGLTVGRTTGSVQVLLPSKEFMGTVQKYIDTNDVKVLEDLESKCPLKISLWNNGNLNCHI